MKHSIRFYENVRKIVSFILRPWLKRGFLFDDSAFPPLPERFLLVTNHVINFDPLMVTHKTRRFLFFVATEHLFSMGWISKVITWLINPSPRAQGGNASSTVMEILRKLKNEGSVGLCVEGNCTWDGVTAPFLPATGKMARAAGVPLVTVHVSGYLARPRWAFTRRKGPVDIRLVGVYQPEELKQMKPEEINELIARDIFEDAYATQEKDPHPYPGKRLAEGLEFALQLCPHCHSFDRLESRDKRFSCQACGFSVTYDEWGYFNADEGETPFKTVRDWDAWQTEYLTSLDLEELPAAEDTDMQLLQIEEHQRIPITTGTLQLDPAGLSIGEKHFALEELSELAIRYKGVVSFSDQEGRFYELLKSNRKKRYHGRKYLLLYQRLKP